ncbi:SUPPRESSOR OF ABI3-5 isoform X5 [Salvia hispanica]|uniref:SUPPRESSOR OF ABI3-5 isoform X5 n=1 Tax=Salvia hispanica TaxID=49212 RepID=UPI0020094E25|nr:SUPPRESSOR OF ABI3-5 isoform X5 [Salvia hispanica]XP_047968017.1 SUPPRESSOR OF ABI3-5 isoform X5 [Salvia hispanica]
MDPGRYGLHQGWENNSALEGYGAAHDTNFRDDGSYDDRRFIDERFSRDNIYPRGAFHRDVLERDNYPPPPSSVGMWPQTRRRSYEEEYSLDRDIRRHEKPPSRYGGRDREDYAYDDYDYRSRVSHQSKEDSRDRDYDHGRHSYDSDYERSGRRDGNWRRRESRDREWDKRGVSRERDESPYRRHEHSPSRSRSRSRGRDDRARSKSPRGRSHGRSYREDSYEDSRYERGDRRRDREDRRQINHSVAPSATVVVKGLSQKTTEEDLYQILAEWGPLRHVRVIKERNSGVSRGFAFIDFPSVDSAQAMMDKLGHEGLLVDGRKLFFEYSSKPTGSNGSLGMDSGSRSGHGTYRSMMVPSDWMCTICGCVNFARRTSCFQCNEPRTEDAPPADMASSNFNPAGKRGESGPTHVLVVRGLDENADEEMLRYEFSKHAPIKDLRLVRDKFTHVSRGFAFIHFYSVEDATKALEATNGTTLEKNGQILRVAYAKSIVGPGSAVSGASQSSSLAAAAIEAATFAQQYDAVGWAPKEYNPEDNQSGGGHGQSGHVAGETDSSAPQSGFVWDEASGYYYDATSGFYYDGTTGLYYDGNNGLWYSYDQQTQQYIPCNDQNGKTSEKQIDASKTSDASNNRKVIISAPAATITSNEKAASLPDAVQAAAAAALAAEKKEKEKLKEIKLASKSSIMANKKKMNNVLTMWKQRSNEGQAPRVALEDNQPSASVEERSNPASSMKSKLINEGLVAKENVIASAGMMSASTQSAGIESQNRTKPISASSSGTLKGVIRSSGLGVVKYDSVYMGPEGTPASSFGASSAGSSSLTHSEHSTPVTPFRTGASALGRYAPSSATGSGKRRFSEMPTTSVTNKEQSQSTYRDRAAERRSLYGSSSAFGDDDINAGIVDSKNLCSCYRGHQDRDPAYRRGGLDSMPFPPGVGGGRSSGDANIQSYEVITADKAIDESNVGNRMLRNMGWHEGSGLGRDGSGMVEPVQAQATETRAGLGIHQPKKVDPSLEVQAGDSYKAVIQKKAIARFREMS